MMICTLLCPEVKFSGALIQDTRDEISQIESFCDKKGSNCIKLVVLLKLNSPFQYLLWILSISTWTWTWTDTILVPQL